MTAALAGCADSADDTDPTTGAGTGDTTVGSGSPGTATTSRTGTGSESAGLDDHPSTAGLAEQPTLGPDPTVAPAVVVAFEDPSCPNCRAFERDTFPNLRAAAVEDESLSFVYRNFPFAYPWGRPAMQALESTYARDAAAFWSLKAHYFAEQPSFSTANVFRKTREFLAANASVDAEAVVADAEAEVHDAAVQADVDAGNDAGVPSTPTCFLFRDGAYVTRVSGARSYSVFATALGL